MRGLTLLFAVVWVVACASSEPPPPPEEEIMVSVVDSASGRGVRAEYLVEADVAATSNAILEIQARPENSMIVAAARIVRRDAAEGLVILRLHPSLGVREEALYQYRTKTTGNDEYAYHFQISPARKGGRAWQVLGSYIVRREGDGCRVVYQFTSTHPALRRDELMKLIRFDSTAVMDHAER